MANEITAPARPKRISKKVHAAIDAMITGEVNTISDAAKRVGLSREHLSRELGHPHVNRALRGKALRNLTMAAARASAVKVDLLDSSSEIVRDRASSFILSMSGIAPEHEAANRAGALPPGLTIIIETQPNGAAPAIVSRDPKVIEHEE